MFGSHLSIAGAMINALREAESLGLDCVQVFTKNQQQWKAPPLSDGVVGDWQAEIKRLGWTSTTPGAPGRAVSHASYLINLASPDDELWRKSVDLMQEEIERCERLSIPYLVHHPGAFTTSSLDAGLARIAEAYRELFRRTAGYRTTSCLENTAGGGSTIGREFQDLGRLRALIIETTGQPDRIGFCFDTCHAHAAGYDMSSRKSAAATLDQFDAACGLTHLRVLHLSDSKGKCGSRLDRHEHIGQGTIGIDGFAAVINDPRMTSRPMILETPKGGDDHGVPFDTINLGRLRAILDGANSHPIASQATGEGPRSRSITKRPKATRSSRSRSSMHGHPPT